MGSSKAAFCGILQGRRGGASRWARLRRPSTGFCNGGAARSAAVHFCPSLPRRPAVLLSLPSARTTMPHEHIPVHANRRAVPTLFHIFPARPSHASSFTLPPAIGYRVRTPRRCSPKGSSEAAFCGVLQGRRGGASRWARLRRLSAGFSNGGAARSAAVPFCPSLPRRPGNGCRAPVPAHANRRAVPTLFHIFPRARVMLLPLPCRPANDTAHGRRNNACRRACLRRPSAGC